MPRYTRTAVRSAIRPPLAPQQCHHRLHSPRPHPYTATHTARDSTPDSGKWQVATTTCLDHLRSHPRAIRPSTASPPARYTATPVPNEYWVWHPRPSLSTRHGNTLLATQTSAVAIKTCLDYLHSHTRAMRPSTGASPIYRCACSQRILGVAPRPSLSTRHGNTRCSQPKPRQW
jgi:hypothetical protein